jgi:hypothetical protein
MRVAPGMVDILGVWLSMAGSKGRFGPPTFVGLIAEYGIGEMTESRKRQQLEKRKFCSDCDRVDMSVDAQLSKVPRGASHHRL